MNPTLLETSGLCIQIGGHRLCRDLNLRLQTGERYALLGANGAGKTTLLHTLAGLRQPQAGRITLADRPLSQTSRKEIARAIGLLFQDAGDGFPSTVLETALMGRHPHLDGWGWESGRDRDLALQALAQMDLLDLQHRDNRSLSGGERQRLALATLLTQQPRIALLDEPANHLDPGHQIRLLNRVLESTRTQNTALMMSLHDPNLALRFCDRALLLFEEGEWRAGPAGEVITAAHLERLYGHPVQAVEQNGNVAFIPE